MTDPRMTPTNDAPVTVEQCDRVFAAKWGLCADDDPNILSGLYDDWPFLQATARHRLAALASAPTGDHIPDAGKMIAPAGDGVAARLKYDAPQGTGQFEVFDPEPDNHHSALYLVDPNGAAFNVSCWDEVGLDIARAEWMRDNLNAALARPRAAVGEQSREVGLRHAVSEAKRNLSLTQGCLECNADDERRWAETIEWLERLS